MIKLNLNWEYLIKKKKNHTKLHVQKYCSMLTKIIFYHQSALLIKIGKSTAEYIAKLIKIVEVCKRYKLEHRAIYWVTTLETSNDWNKKTEKKKFYEYVYLLSVLISGIKCCILLHNYTVTRIW